MQTDARVRFNLAILEKNLKIQTRAVIVCVCL